MNLLRESQGARKIGISGHIRPDGDCVSSCLALYQYLSKCFPDVYLKVFLEKSPAVFRKLKGYDDIDSTFAEDTVFDLFFALDCAPDRLGEAEKYFRAARKSVNIDHHISNPGGGMLNFIRPEAGSTCELIYDLMEKDRLDGDLAMAIYTGMIHDTGVFQYSNTTPEAMEKAARLLRFGFDFSGLIEETFYQKTYLQSQILGRTLLESIRFLDGRCIVGHVSRKVMKFYDAAPGDLDGIVNHLRNIKGIECAIFLYQTGVLTYKVSLRGSEKVDVAKIAMYFGGGGHIRAAGCTMEGTFHDCVNNLSRQIAEQLGKA